MSSTASGKVGVWAWLSTYTALKMFFCTKFTAIKSKSCFFFISLFFQIVLCPQTVSIRSSIIRGHHAPFFAPAVKLAFCHFCFACAIANRFLGSFTIAKGICDWQISPISILPSPLSALHILGTAQAEHHASTVPILLWRNSRNSSVQNVPQTRNPLKLLFH